MCVMLRILLVTVLLISLTTQGNAMAEVIDLLKYAEDNGGGIIYPVINDDWPDRDMAEFYPQGEAGVDYGILSAKLFILPDGNRKLKIKGFGFPTLNPVTGWFVISPADRNHPIYSTGFIIPSLPIAATTSSFNSGRSSDVNPDPNQLIVDDFGRWTLETTLDYDPFKPLQLPLVNSIGRVTQKDFDDTIGGSGQHVYTNLKQNTYRARTDDTYQVIGTEFVREFKDDGTQEVDDFGNPVIARHPIEAGRITIVGHFDYLSHGMGSSIFAPGSGIEKPGLADHFQIAHICFAPKAISTCSGEFYDGK